MTADRAESAASREVAEAHLGEAIVDLLGTLRQGFGVAMRTHDLTPPLAMTLKELDQPRSMRWLADLHGCDASNITGIVDRLERRGLVERRRDPADRRITLVVRTPAGDAIPAALAGLSLGLLPGVADLDDGELDTLQSLLHRLVP